MGQADDEVSATVTKRTLMDRKLRTLLIWLLSLAGLLSLYLLYHKLSATPRIDIPSTDMVAEEAAQSDVNDANIEVGKIGDVGVGTLEKPKFVHRDKYGRVDRVFGFERLVHKVRDDWEIEKPYMNVFMPAFSCYVRADRGTVQVETAAGRTSPKDATLMGNVVIHVVPAEDSDINEGIICLDDVTFLSDRSLFSSSGPVKYISKNSQMEGTGLELIYNEQLHRVELFRIIDLHSLRLDSSQLVQLSTTQDSDTQKSSSAKNKSKDTNEQGEYYRCVLRKNVVIDAPEQVVFARDRVCIDNIFWSKGSGDELERPDPGEPNDATVSDVNKPELPEPNDLPATRGDIFVTCDGGIVIAPRDSSAVKEESDTSVVPAGDSPSDLADAFSAGVGKSTTIARAADYDVSTGDTILHGPLKLGFLVDVNDLFVTQGDSAVLPAEVTAQKQATLSPDSNQLVLEGDCAATMFMQDPNVDQKYTLSAETFIVDLPEDVNHSATVLTSDIEHFTAAGGQVKLTITETVNGKLVRGIELKCRETEYDADRQVFAATGPGTLTLDNSNVTQPGAQPGEFSLRRPCYALLWNFSTLTYFLKPNEIIADAKPQDTLQIDYFPVVEGDYSRHATATANQVKLHLVQAADGRSELANLVASGQVTYTDEDNQLIGSELFYDREESVIEVRGDESQACYLNGALVQKVVYDPKTGKLQTEIIGPGPLQVER